MSNKARTMLILSCVFITITAVLLFFDAYFSGASYSILFGSNPETFGEAIGAALGGILLYAMTILLSAGVLLFAILTLPFDIILLKENGKKWYSITILVVAITAILAAIVFVAMLPIVGNAQSAAEAAKNSSSSIESMSELLVL